MHVNVEARGYQRLRYQRTGFQQWFLWYFRYIIPRSAAGNDLEIWPGRGGKKLAGTPAGARERNPETLFISSYVTHLHHQNLATIALHYPQWIRPEPSFFFFFLTHASAKVFATKFRTLALLIDNNYFSLYLFVFVDEHYYILVWSQARGTHTHTIITDRRHRRRLKDIVTTAVVWWGN